MSRIRYFIGFSISGLWLFTSLNLHYLFVILIGLTLFPGTFDYLWLIYHTLGRDARAAYRYLRLLLLMKYYEKKDLTVPEIFQKSVKKYGDKTCLHFENQSWSFNDLESYSNRVAHYLIDQGFKPGECIALWMENRLEYVGIWMGCAKIGVVPALVNSNIFNKPFIHSITSAEASAIIVGTELLKPLNDVKKDLPPNLRIYHSSGVGGSDEVSSNPPGYYYSIDLDEEIKKFPDYDVSKSIKKPSNFRSKLLYIFTSGTTGLPKAAVVKQSRFFYYGGGTFYMNNMGNISDPCFYNPLPLYHSAGGVAGIGLMVMFGVTIVIRKKFSVRNFWKDCIKYKCNGAQYIGEICRYLLSSPETPEDKSHNIQILFGNGLRPALWDQFVSRFGISRIAEFYGSTEGNTNLSNVDCKAGAVGFASLLFPFIYPVRLIKVNEDGSVYRDPKTGLAVLCKPGDRGELLGKIVSNHVTRSFDGYVDKVATEAKIVSDVLYKGDLWFRSGDLLVMDDMGWLYFIDRMGDTFRWKGENVSTIEVESALSNILNHQDTVVYGVQIPGTEGRAGMAAIIADNLFNVSEFLSALKNQLPSYMTPMFLRLVKNIDITGTFKIKKVSLQKDGFNPNIIEDTLYFLDSKLGEYRKLDNELFEDIMAMRLRF